MQRISGVLLLILLGGMLVCQTSLTANDNSVYAKWENGISTDDDYFPIAVWLQSPRNAERYRKAGINLYVGLWNGPTEDQLASLKKAGMQVICSQNKIGLRSQDADVIVGWMHGDEPDNAQAKESGGYGPPIEPKTIVDNYHKLRQRDSSRPILLNLGQGVAYDNYVGRGVRRNHLEDYPRYIRGSDIVSFDIYPAVHDKPEVAGKLEFVPRGVRRLRQWSNNEKIVWNCIECSRISNTEVKPSADQIRAEVWMSLIAGSRGIIYFVHQFEPSFKEASVLDDPELLSAITSLNRRIKTLAPVLNSPTQEDLINLDSTSSAVAKMAKRHDGSLYLFIANESAEATSMTIQIDPLQPVDRVEFIDQDKSKSVENQQLELKLPGYGIQLLRFSASDA